LTRRDFLRRLSRKKALQLVEPSPEIRDVYLKKSRSRLESARHLLSIDKFEESTEMAYYSMYHSLMALFFACGIKCENHTVAGWLLADVFGLDNTVLESAKKERLDKEYYVPAAPVRPDVEALIRTAESFNAVLLDKIERLTREEIENYRKQFRKLLE
jgi:uncharacterized protein (UPF0332 family)